jgi:hypothetical protein
MNPYTGGLMRLKATTEVLAEGFLPLPKELLTDAEAALAGQDRAKVDLRKRGPLQDWAKKKRKAKIAAKSRRANRA